MKIFSYLNIALCLFFITCTPFVCNAAFTDGQQARIELQQQVSKLVAQEAYQDLENIAADYRIHKVRFTDGGWKLNVFYMTFSEGKRTDSEWRKLIADLEAWNRAYSQSVTAQTALGCAWFGYAWHARGRGFADKVTDDGWKLFRERKERAYELAKESVAGSSDCPERYNLLLRLASGLNWSEERYWNQFRKAIAFSPEYEQYYLTAAIHLLPRWGGTEGAWLRFAEKSADSAPAGSGNILYALIISRIQQFGEFSSLLDSGISWERVRSGYREMSKKYPNSSWNANRFALFACLAGDKKTVREIMGDEKFIYQMTAWPKESVDPDECRVQSGLPTFREEAAQRSARQMHAMQQRIFRELVNRAERGEHQAMAMVAEMLFRGEGTERNAVKAYAWLVLSGEPKEHLQEVASSLSPDLQREAQYEVERLRNRLLKVK